MVHKKSISGPLLGTATKLTTTNNGANEKQPPKFTPLSLPALDFSLTKGTMIPSPPETPPSELENEQQTPTPGGGPLSSHPTTPIVPAMSASAFFPPATPTNTAVDLKANRVLGRDQSEPLISTTALPQPTNGFTPKPPTSVSSRRASISSRTTSSIKRFFSFRSSRGASISSSANCFDGAAAGNGPVQPARLGLAHNGTDVGGTPVQQTRPATSLGVNGHESSPANADGAEGNTSLRKKRSSTWFGSAARRRSDMWQVGQVDENDAAAAVETPPTIQEVSVDTELGADDMFKDIH